MKLVRSLLLFVSLLVVPEKTFAINKGDVSNVNALIVKPSKAIVGTKKNIMSKSFVLSEKMQDEIPFFKNLENSAFSVDQKQALTIAWSALYELFKSSNASSASTTITPQQVVAMSSLFEMNCLEAIQEYLDPKTFPKLLNDSQSELHTNYATHHLRKAVTRFDSVFSIDYNHGSPKTVFEGDNRDIGIIVNVNNNTNAQFTIHQTSLDGKLTSKIGQLVPGFNAVNLHTSALQEPATSRTIKAPVSSVSSFSFQEVEVETPTIITVRMMSGIELVQFLRTLPRDQKAVMKDTFEMNGLPTSPEYLAEPKDWYVVLIQNPTSSTSTHRNLGQRIQAINVSKLIGPYLLTMQINDQSVEMQGSNAVTGSKKTFFQPSFTMVQIMQNQTMLGLDIPLLILPQFLWELPMMQTLWMLLSTTILATQTEGKFFGKDSFGDAYEYFKGLNCFSNQARYSLFIDRYNAVPVSVNLYDAPWLMSSVIYETNLDSCSDVSKIYSAQDVNGHIVANAPNFYYINFQVLINTKMQSISNHGLFVQSGFNAIYSSLQNKTSHYISSALKADIKGGIFASITKIKSGIYLLVWTNKKNKILNSQYLYFDDPVSNIELSFVSESSDYIGSTYPVDFDQILVGSEINFKILYEVNYESYRNILLAQPTSPIDKQEMIFLLNFSTYPITELYLDVFNTFNVIPYTRCFIVKNGNLPVPLMSLTEQDWRTGIYFIPVVRNQEKISSSSPGALTVIFYKSDKTLLGEMTTLGQFNNTSEVGIKEPVVAYNLKSAESNSWTDIYLSTGIFLKYNPVDPALVSGV